jgi:hypothetical protein
MSDDGGTGFGFFLALVVLITGLPTILWISGMYRRKNYPYRFEARLGEAALKCTTERRRAYVLQQVQEMDSSIRSRSVRLIRKLNSDSDASISEDDKFEERILRVFKADILDGCPYWGIGDILLPEGRVVSRGDISIITKPSLMEDFVFTACNTVNPLPLMLGDSNNPESNFSRFVVYCTAQAFALILFLVYHETYTAMSYLWSPIVVLCEHWLRLTLFCPCLSDDPLQSAEGDTADSKHKAKRWSVLAMRHSLRIVGGLLALPMMLIFLFLLIAIAIILTRHQVNPVYLASFLWDGILFPFLIKLILLSMKYCTFVHPTFVKVCGFTILEINRWTQSALSDTRLNYLSELPEEERFLEEDKEKKRLHNSVDLCHSTCYCIRCSELTDQHHNTVDCLHPSFYVRDANICCVMCSRYFGLFGQDNHVEAAATRDAIIVEPFLGVAEKNTTVYHEIESPLICNEV